MENEKHWKIVSEYQDYISTARFPFPKGTTWEEAEQILKSTKRDSDDTVRR